MVYFLCIAHIFCSFCINAWIVRVFEKAMSLINTRLLNALLISIANDVLIVKGNSLWWLWMKCINGFVYKMNFLLIKSDYSLCCIYNVTLKSKHYSGRGGVSNHQRPDCSLNRTKKTSKLRVTGFCVGNSPVTGESPHKWPVCGKCFQLMRSSWMFSMHW